MQNINYLKNFDFLRIVFTLCIVLHHIFNQYKITNNAASSVEFFFIMSGFFLTYTCERQKSVWDFILKKIIRFLPLMLFSVVSMSIIRMNFSYEQMLAPLLFMPSTGLFGNFIGSPAIWYVCVLFWVSIFYFYIIKNCSRISVNICIGLLTFYNYIACIHYGWGLSEPLGNMLIFTQGMARGIAGMGCGYFIAMIYQSSCLKHYERSSLFYTFLEALTFIYIFIGMFTLDAPENRIFLVVAFMVIIWLFLAKKGAISRYFECVPCDRVSKYCLSLFLTHEVVIKAVSKSRLQDLLHQDALISLVFFMAIAAGLSVYYLFEKPCAECLRSKIINQ